VTVPASLALPWAVVSAGLLAESAPSTSDRTRDVARVHDGIDETRIAGAVLRAQLILSGIQAADREPAVVICSRLELPRLPVHPVRVE